MTGAQWARMSASLTYAHSTRCAAAVSLLQLVLLGRERLHDAHAVDVLVDDGRDLGEARLGQPRDREHVAPHADRRRCTTNGIVDIATNASGTLIVSISANARTATPHCTRTVGAIARYIWTCADVGVAARDELARLDPVVERERHPAEVLVDDVPEVVLDAVRRL